MRPVNPLFAIVQSFFDEHLKKVRGASSHTVAAYRDALKLFFQFVADESGVSTDRLSIGDLHVDNVSAFLQHLEKDRHNQVSTRNCRRIALRCFFQHALRQDPVHSGQYARVLALPPKRSARNAPRYLEPNQMRLLLEQPNRRTPSGQRDFALLLFLYNTGARVSEAVAVSHSDFQLTPPYQVRLLGKGRKERYCPLWSDTVRAIKGLLAGGTPATGTVFRGIRGNALSRHGATYIVSKHAKAAVQTDSTFPLHVSPHMLRHSCACALLQAGVDLTVIRDYLGHASIVTTNRYANSNLKLKREALANFWEKAGLVPSRASVWRPTKTLLSYLAAL